MVAAQAQFNTVMASKNLLDFVDVEPQRYANAKFFDFINLEYLSQNWRLILQNIDVVREVASYLYGVADGLTSGALSAVATSLNIDTSSLTSSWAYTYGFVQGIVSQIILTSGVSGSCGVLFWVFKAVDIIHAAAVIHQKVEKFNQTGELGWMDAVELAFVTMAVLRMPQCFIAGTQVLVADHVLEVAAETTEDLLALLLPSLTIAAGAATLAGVGLAIHRRKTQQDGLPPGGPPRKSTTRNLLENGAQLMDDLVDDVLYGFGASPAPQLAGLPADWEDFMDDALCQATHAPLSSTPPPSTTPALRRFFSLAEREIAAASAPDDSPVTDDSHTTETNSSTSQKSSSWLSGGILASLLLTLLFGSAWAWTANRDKPAPTVTSQTVYTTRNIEDIEVGDTVVSFNEETGENQVKPVTDAFDRVSDHLRILEIETADGELQTLETTNEHPFFTPHSGWVNAGELQVGDTVLDHQRQAATVRRTEYEPHPEGVAVYNLTVADSHTYFAGEQRSESSPFLVHNTCVSSLKGVHSTDKHMNRIANEIRDAVSQAKKALKAGGTGGTAWGKIYQNVKGSGGWFERVAKGNAIQQIADTRLLNNRFLTKAGVVFNRKHLLSTPGSGKLLRPDYQVRLANGKLGIIDITTPGQAGKIIKYDGPDILHLINILY
ncbi:polymorphic toxin-type HINT domain-containing protein [Lignipirellula cremea]|uniref:polymorphic toxin-type HINT domain-containing protein n=1 Tax=Lignipirellula cremea TaxID=2528010 RepID=UPI0011A98D32|nr:polymorphic toxin-type HINT domain-containing protein [Lignipirellula cremea]